MGWVKEGDWPWKYHIEIQTSSPASGSTQIADTGICGNKTMRYDWGGGKTQAQAIQSIERKFRAIIRELKKDLKETKGTIYTRW